MPTLNNVVVAAKARNGKAIKIGEDDWYSAFSAGQLADVNYRDTVSFTYKEKEKGGTVYLNIVGTPTVDTKYEDAGGTVSPASSSKSKSYEKDEFPVPLTSRSRSIVRQNSLGHAVEIYPTVVDDDELVTLDDKLSVVLDIAARFEAYSCGDVERAEAEEMMKKMQEDV